MSILTVFLVSQVRQGRQMTALGAIAILTARSIQIVTTIRSGSAWLPPEFAAACASAIMVPPPRRRKRTNV